jgi:UDP-N-acetylglucosamine 2-epimerase (non-hydrolysing)
MLIVVGDVNSTLAAALTATKMTIPLAHVEAGLRSRDRTMPEEINRMVTDRLSDLLLTTEAEARSNLIEEGVEPERICFVGNVMIDSLHFALARAIPAARTLAEFGLETGAPGAKGRFGLVTLHRPSNVDDPDKLGLLLAALKRLSARLPLFFPAHPRTRAIMEKHGLLPGKRDARFVIAPPVSYFQAVGLMRDARLVITDSGGMQEETTALGVPCLTFRDTTERPVTIEEGTNRLVGADPAALERAVLECLAWEGGEARIPPFWDGRAAPRILRAVANHLERASHEARSLVAARP